MLETVARRRAVVVSALAAGALAVSALPASAHVTVSPTALPQGATAELTFKVPNEESGATVTGLQLQIPTRYPIAQVLPKNTPGWTVTVHTVKLAKPLTTDDGTFTTAVDEIDWTGGAIPVGQYQDFAISVDPLPTTTDQLVFKAVQTYSNGDVVRWIDLSSASDTDPDHPAPVLTLTRAGAGDGSDAAAPAASGAGAAAQTTGAPAAASASSSSSGSTSSTVALGLAAAALAAALAALALAVLGRRRAQ